VAFARAGDLDAAISDYTQVIQLNADLANAYYNRGLAYRQKGDSQRAEADFAKARQLTGASR
jgi:tetratricopeptide (TPR) repeat protein